MDLIWVNLKNICPTSFKFISICMKASYIILPKSFLFLLRVLVILPVKDHHLANLNIRDHNNNYYGLQYSNKQNYLKYCDLALLRLETS